MLQNILLIAGGVLAGAIAALRIIAPRTKTPADDAVLAKLETLEAFVMQIHGIIVPTEPAPPA